RNSQSEIRNRGAAMSTVTPQEMTLDAIRSVPLFASLDDEAANDLRNLLRIRDVPSGAPLFRAGDQGDAMYLIESGRVRITISDDDQKEIVLAELAQGDFIGAAVGIIIAWIVFHSVILISGFDPAPYQMLNLVMGIIAGLQAPIIMMSQNRQGSKDRLRADLDFQVNLKNELALTEVLRRL